MLIVLKYNPNFRSYEPGPYLFIYLNVTLHITNRMFTFLIIFNNTSLQLQGKENTRKIFYSIFIST